MDSDSESKWVICRTCLKGEGKMVKIFKENDNDLVYKIEECAGVVLDTTIDLPDKICEKCLMLLKAANKFRTTCRRSQDTLLKKFGLIVRDKEPIVSQEDHTTSFEKSKTSITDHTVPTNEVVPMEIHAAPIGQIPTTLDNYKVQTTDQTPPPDFPIEFLKMKPPKPERNETDKTNTQGIVLAEPGIVVQEDPYTIEFTEEHELLNEPHDDLTSTNEVSFVTLGDDLKPTNLIKPEIQNFEFVLQIDSDEKSSNFKIVPTNTNKSFETNTVKTVQPKKTYIRQKQTEKTKSSQIYENEDGNYECPQCDNVYEKKTKLLQHLKVHSQDKPHQCEICNKRFAQTPQLARHMNTHTGLRPFECPFCSACFADPSTRIKHIRTHTNERPYKCDVCHKSFAYSNVLKVHVMTHTGEKPYSCRVCGKQFSQAHHKKNHERTHLEYEIKIL